MANDERGAFDILLGAGKIEITKRLEPVYDWLVNSEAGHEIVKLYDRSKVLAAPVFMVISHALESYHKSAGDAGDVLTDILSDGVSELYHRLDQAASELGADADTVKQAKNFLQLLFEDVRLEDREKVVKFLASLSHPERTALLALLSGFDSRQVIRLASSTTTGRTALLRQLLKIAMDEEQVREGARRAAEIEQETARTTRDNAIRRTLHHSNNVLSNRLAGRG